MADSTTQNQKPQSPPSHPELFHVEFLPGSFNSRLVSDKLFLEGEVICNLQGLTKGPKAYSSVQCGSGDDEHVELNSDLVYMNHSCEPNVYLDLSSDDQTQWKVHAMKEIKPGEGMCFFYPSTEWQMNQPFTCNCGNTTCLGELRGAKFLTLEELSKRGFINNHIREMKNHEQRKS